MIRKSCDQAPLSFRQAVLEQHQALLDRRAFLKTSLASSAALLMSFGAVPAASNAASADQLDFFDTLDSVLNHLLPSEAQSPGAKDIQALNYFRFILSNNKTDVDDIKLIKNGIGWLNDLAITQQQASFVDLNAEQREAVLRKTAQSKAGDLWIATVLIYLFEALLTAPIYAGNPNGIGWQWLQHTPGFPLPDSHNRFDQLAL